MEAIKIEKDIERFLAINSGDGDGYGSGYGYDSGYGFGGGCEVYDDGYYDNGDDCGYSDDGCHGYGFGYCSGSGYGYSYGYGYGSSCGGCSEHGFGAGDGYAEGNGNHNYSGYGDGEGGIKSYNGQKVYIIDNIMTIIYSVKNNLAKGATLNDDLRLTPCCIAKIDHYFAHGLTAHEAYVNAQAKALRNESIEDRVKRFVDQYPDFNTKIPVQELFVWHNILTGSCEFGRLQFVKNHGINLETDAFTVKEFIELTKDAYEGNVIKKLLTYKK